MKCGVINDRDFISLEEHGINILDYNVETGDADMSRRVLNVNEKSCGISCSDFDVCIYTDGSKFDGSIGFAACLFYLYIKTVITVLNNEMTKLNLLTETLNRFSRCNSN